MSSSRYVCIVEDQADFRFLLQVLFKRSLSAYPVRFFSSGEDLLQALPTLSPLPDLILLDRHMPGLDGHKTLLRLKEHRLHRLIRVVMMSAEASPAEINDCYLAGANSFIRKELDFESLGKLLLAVCQYWLELNEPCGALQ